KRYRLRNNHQYYKYGNLYTKNILVANNAIYLTAIFNDNFDVVAKLDLDGNIIWSRSFGVGTSNYSSRLFKPMYANNALLLQCVYGVYTNTDIGVAGITKLNEADGTVTESYTYKPFGSPLLNNMAPFECIYNVDNSISLTGFIEDGSSFDLFNTLLDGGLNPLHSYYYKSSTPLSTSLAILEFNRQKQHAFLFQEGFNINNKYFIIFGKNDEVLRSRKFIIPAITGGRYALNFDDKQNLHFLSQYTQSSKLVTEYSRVSNFAPNGTLGCFGKDSSILTQYPFTITKQPFTWDNIQSNVIVSNNVPYIEDTAFVTKELVCKIVSYCDSINIKGPATVCLNQPVRYTVNKNNGCFKNSDWLIDTSFANIINTEGDSAINISFKKPFAGYIHAAINDCVVKDSFFVATVPPKVLKLAKRDSLLCPGKSITLKADSLYSQYQWQDGSTADSLLVSGPGFYKLTAVDFCGFTSADSITIALTDSTLNIPTTQAICKYDTAFITLPADVNNITWQPFTNALLNNKTLLLYPLQNTVYRITAERIANCPITKTTAVTVTRCPEIVFLPNAFTPDNNGLNDVFKASATRPLTFYRLIIFNRYGQKLFETNNPATGWDGNFKNSKQPTGGYVYQCSYSFASGYQKTEGGYFMLIR
ncbi:MAG: gliding motility-associated C-terminal domain-containing protein, partial [Ferruginibacter sp.]